jgi:RHS repeat-associated protein
MKSVFNGLLITALICVLAATSYATCGNPETPTRKPKCGPCASPSPDPGCAKDGTNNFDVYTGNVHRQVTDIVVNGGVGDYQLKFERTMTSRYLGAVSTPLGTSGSWRHSYLWNITYAGQNSIGNEIINIDYPEGENWQFDRKVATDHYLTAVSQTEDRVEQSSSDPNQYYLIFGADGGKLSFRKISTSPVTYQVQGLIDPHGLSYPFTLDVKGRVTKVSEPAGRYIQITYGSVGNFPNGNVKFSYYNPTATSVNLAGEFNNWDTNSISMVNNSGTWSVTIPLQLAAAYQYKFVVNHSTWVPDPANWNTVPAGGPSTGNNSLVTNNDTGTATGASVPITFTYTNATAAHVYVAGQFNSWSSSANPLTKNGSTWTTTLSLTQGSYQYKFVVDGNWIQDPTNSFTAPDGYGGYNSKLAVGPLDEGITQVQASDGRTVTYTYTAFASGFAIYSSLLQVNYGDGTHATYSYDKPFTLGGRPVPVSVDDPRYRLGEAGSRMAYTYQNTGVDGFVYQEKSLATGTVLHTLSAPDETTRTVTHGNGGTTTYTFSDYQLVAKSTSAGVSGTAAYSDGGYGMVTTVTPVAGQPTSFDRLADFGVVQKTTFPDLKYILKIFTDNTKPFFPASIQDENGNVTRYTYTTDGTNRVSRIDYPDTGYETFEYNGFGQVTSHRLRNGFTESATFDTAGRMTSKTNAAQKTTTYTYDSADRVQTVTDPRTNTTTYSYNDRGQVTQIVYNNDTTHPQIFAYDPYGNKTSFTNEIGKTWIYEYDEYSRLISVTNPLSKKTQYSYSASVGGGCSSCSSVAAPTLITLPSGKQTKIVYDDDWRKTDVTVGFGTSDAATTHYDYDGVGNVTQIKDPRGKFWKYTYDSRNRKTKATDPNGNYTEWTYDWVGNKLTEKRSADVNPIIYGYDAANHLTDVTDQASNNTHMTRDGAGNMLTMRDARLNTYTFTYDGMNRKTRLDYPTAGGSEIWAYDDAGNLQTYTTRAGQTQTFTYDNRNRETNMSWSDSTPAVAKSYDAAGRLLTLTSSVSALSYSYDDANQMLSETQQILSDGGPKSVGYTYDDDGNRATVTYPSGSTSTLGYTNRNQPNSIMLGAISASYNYDLNGNRVTKTLSNGTITSYEYDDANRVLTIDNQNSGASFVREDYAYNAVNTRASRTETIGAASKLDAYGYDQIDQVVSARYNYNAGTNTQDRLVGYNYDAVGNRSGTNGVTDSVNGNTNYGTPNNLNEYASGSLGLPYDTNGNVSGQNGWSYTYDSHNRITSAYTNGTTISFAYDGRNRCVSRTVDSTVTFFYYDGWNLIEERDGSNGVLAWYVNGPKIDEIVTRVVGTSNYYYHCDALGSTVALTDLNGSATERYTYDAFGKPTFKDGAGNVVSSSASGNRFLFTGREYIQQAALYDYRNRVYSPQQGRFLQIDPVRFGAGDQNLYRYVKNSAVDQRDPSGLGDDPLHPGPVRPTDPAPTKPPPFDPFDPNPRDPRPPGNGGTVPGEGTCYTRDNIPQDIYDKLPQNLKDLLDKSCKTVGPCRVCPGVMAGGGTYGACTSITGK